MTTERLLGGLAPHCLVALVLTLGVEARADDEALGHAREEFLRGATLVKNAQWAEALTEFEHSALNRPHSITTYNIGACQRAMGRYTVARETFLKARAQNDAAGGTELPQQVLADLTGYLDEIQRLLVDVAVTMDPPASVAIDGRPLDASKSTPGVFVGGVRPPGPPEPAPATFHVLLDPGVHVFTFTREGFADGVVNKTFAPGPTTLKLELDRLPATLHITSDPSGAATSIEGVDVGATPVDLSRPSGSYRIAVKKSGYLSYESKISAQPGESANVFAKLPIEKPTIVQRWWFWTGLGVIVVGGVVGAYFIALSQQTPQMPAVNGGGLGWKIPVP